MTSEIRANTLKNRVGLGTVSFTNTGPVVSGIVTANTFRLPDATSGSLGRLQFGNGLDLSLFHDGTNSFLVNNTGYLSIQSQDGVNGIFIARNAEVNLYYGPSVRMQTSSAGITVNKDLDVDGHTNLDNVSIAGIVTASSNIHLEDYIFHKGDTSAYFGFPGDDTILFGTSSAQRLRLDSGGRLLINRTNNDAPGGSASKLQIRDTTYTASIAVVRNDPGGGGPSLVFGKSRNATQSDNTLVQNGDILGQISFFGADGSDMNSTGAMIVAQVDGTPGNNDMPGRLVFKTTADGSASSTERVRIDSSGFVGVGTATIGRGPLELSRSDTGDVQIHMTNAKTGGGTGRGFTIFGCNASAGDAGFVNRHNGGAIEFYTNQGGTISEKLRIDSSGRLLVNTTSASISSSELFEVKSTGTGFSHFRNNSSTYAPIYIDNEASNNGSTLAPLITFTDGGGNRAGFLLNNSSDFNISGAGSVSFSTGSNIGSATERLHIDNQGRITIGSGIQNQYASSFNSGANQLLITSNGSTGLTIDSTSSTSSSIHFADGSTGSESYRGIIEYNHSNDDMKFAVEGQHVARLRKGSYSDVGGGMIIGSSSSDAGVAHSDSRTLILGHTTHGETGITLVNSTSGSGKIRFSDNTSPYNQGTIAYDHGTRTVAQIPNYAESLSISPAQVDNQFVLNGNEGIRVCSDMDRQKMVDGFWHKDLTTSFQTVFSIQSGYDNSSPHRAYFYEIIVYGGDWGSHSANRTYFKGFINGYNGYQGHTVIEHSGTYGSDTGGQGHYGSSECQIQVTFTSNGNSHIQMRLTTGSYRAEGYARFIGFIRDYDGFHIR